MKQEITLTIPKIITDNETVMEDLFADNNARLEELTSSLLIMQTALSDSSKSTEITNEDITNNLEVILDSLKNINQTYKELYAHYSINDSI